MERTGGYELYLVIAGCGVLIGATLLLFMKDGRTPSAEVKSIEATVPHPIIPGTAAG